MSNGWIKLHRDVRNHWVYQNAEYFRAWVDIIMDVNHSDKKVIIGGTLYDCDRGESLNSQETWATRWGWGRKRVRNFFKLLENDGMIIVKTDSKTTKLTVVNYRTYQNQGPAEEHQRNIKGPAGEHQGNIRGTSEEHKQECKELEECKERKEVNPQPPLKGEVYQPVYNFKSEIPNEADSQPDDEDFREAMNLWLGLMKRKFFKGRECENLSDALAAHGLAWVKAAIAESKSVTLFERFRQKEDRDRASPKEIDNDAVDMELIQKVIGRMK